jgi:DNA (cytosine-5)-methyltransferase 1
MANKGNSQRRNSENFESKQSRQQSYRIVWANDWKHAGATWNPEKNRWQKYNAEKQKWQSCPENQSWKIYTKHWPDETYHDQDISTIDTDQIPDCDLLVGGFPCQPFSMAGERKGFKDVRGTLFFEIMRIAKAKRPEILFLENVNGLRSHDNGDTFETILRTLGNAGYWWEYKVLNSKFFGVPQTRERVFIIGHLREGCTRQVFPITDDGESPDEIGEVVGTLTGGGHSGGLHSNMTAIVQSGNWNSRGFELRKDNVCNTIQTDGYLRSGSSFGTDKPQSSRNIRRLTPRECERVQGFPDDWTEGISDTQRYKCLGNAVTVPVIKQIGELILEAWN